MDGDGDKQETKERRSFLWRSKSKSSSKSKPSPDTHGKRNPDWLASGTESAKDSISRKDSYTKLEIPLKYLQISLQACMREIRMSTMLSRKRSLSLRTYISCI
jgi:hypothetical protein